jgi:hypothetical protein
MQAATPGDGQAGSLSALIIKETPVIEAGLKSLTKSKLTLAALQGEAALQSVPATQVPLLNCSWA